MFETVGHFLFRPRAGFSYAGIFGAISVGYWVRGFVEKRKRVKVRPVVFEQNNSHPNISPAEVHKHAKNLISAHERKTGGGKP